MDGWRNLSGAELRARLVQRGHSEDDAQTLVNARELARVQDYLDTLR